MPDTVREMVATVDDDPVTLNIVLDALKGQYDVRPFASAATFLKFISATPVDLVLLDYNMPYMDGFELMNFLHKDNGMRNVPILFLTSGASQEHELLALDKGADDYLYKPVEPRILRTRVRHHLELRRHRRHLEAMMEERTRDLAQVIERLQRRENTMLDMLALATDLRDHNTGDHIHRTTEYVRLLIKALRENPKEGYILAPEQEEDIIKSAKLHDVGKIAIPDHILEKQGSLTDEEFAVMKLHTVHGAKFLDQFVDAEGGLPFLAVARDIALYHHERWDGTGYPLGRKGKEIPLAARIATLADVYDALLSERPYKKAFPHAQAVRMIEKESGTHFDPYLVEMFIKYSEAMRIVALNGNNAEM